MRTGTRKTRSDSRLGTALRKTEEQCNYPAGTLIAVLPTGELADPDMTVGEFRDAYAGLGSKGRCYFTDEEQD